tara:strand:- start:397 stop:552 length:156 start_codon:yes stop_codon:yes gene_type:complete
MGEGRKITKKGGQKTDVPLKQAVKKMLEGFKSPFNKKAKNQILGPDDIWNA